MFVAARMDMVARDNIKYAGKRWVLRGVVQFSTSCGGCGSIAQHEMGYAVVEHVGVQQLAK